MRGKVHPICAAENAIRITPAHAGKRRILKARVIMRRDHPRACGEKDALLANLNVCPGSPPRMRGKAGSTEVQDADIRITPAHAGKRQGCPGGCIPNRDHPRACGEKKIANSDELAVEGSPPRMRGKETCAPTAQRNMGITPAHAGKRLKRFRSTVPHAAIISLFPSVCNKPVGSDGNPAERDAPPFLPAENAVPASPACNLRSL